MFNRRLRPGHAVYSWIGYDIFCVWICSRASRHVGQAKGFGVFEHIQPIDLRAERRKRRLIFGIVLSLLLAGYLYYELKNISEERRAGQFFAALQQEDYQEAYRIWQPTTSYHFDDFMEDWGRNGLQGPIHQYRIEDSRARGSGVLVRIRVNDAETTPLWVEKKDKRLSFPPMRPSGPPASRGRRVLIAVIVFSLMLAAYLYYEFRTSAEKEG